MKALTRYTVLVLILVAGSSLSAQQVKNVQVLPFKTEKEITRFMKKKVAKSLGVKCTFCHDVKNKADDSNPNKLVAREMMRMLADINESMTHIQTVADAGGLEGWQEAPIVDCWSCHRGSTKPEYTRPETKRRP